MRFFPHLQWQLAACLALAVMPSIPLVSHATPSDNTDIWGKWRVVAVLDTAEITGISEQRARSLVGKPLNIDATGFQFQNVTCKTPSYARTERDTAKYLRESWHARSGKLGLPARVTVVDARCTDIFLKPSKRMVFNWEGFFLEAEKTSEAP